MAFDCCGNELYKGDIIVYSNITPEFNPVLEVYMVTECIDKDTCKGIIMNTVYEGIELYITDTINRAAFVASYELDTDDEEDELPLDEGFN